MREILLMRFESLRECTMCGAIERYLVCFESAWGVWANWCVECADDADVQYPLHMAYLIGRLEDENGD